jgi:molecular chaperone GrpE
MVDLFQGMGLQAVPTIGSPFDPELHDGIMKEETVDQADGTVLEEFRKGFTFSGKLLRPAMVKVAVNSSTSEGQGSVQTSVQEVPSDASAPEAEK